MSIIRMTGRGRVIRRRGGSLLEMALVLPVLLYLAFGTIEFGYFFYVKSTLQGAAREGARAAIASTAQYSDITSAVTGSMTAASLSGSGFSVTVQDNGRPSPRWPARSAATRSP